MVLVACAVVVGCLDSVSGLSPSSTRAVLTVPEVNASRDALVGMRIQVSGRVRAQPRPGDADSDAPGAAAETYQATLHLVNPDEPKGDRNILNLYRSGQGGLYERLTCEVRPGSIRDCGKYAPDSLMTIEGTWMRQQVPAGQVVHPGGRIEVIAWRTEYFLLVA